MEEQIKKAWIWAFSNKDDWDIRFKMGKNTKELYDKMIEPFKKAEKIGSNPSLNEIIKCYNLKKYKNIEAFESFFMDFLSLDEKMKVKLFPMCTPTFMKFFIIYCYKIEEELQNSGQKTFVNKLTLLPSFFFIFNGYYSNSEEFSMFKCILSTLFDTIYRYFPKILEISKEIFLSCITTMNLVLDYLKNNPSEEDMTYFGDVLIRVLYHCIGNSVSLNIIEVQEFCKSFFVVFKKSEIFRQHITVYSTVLGAIDIIPPKYFELKLLGVRTFYLLDNINENSKKIEISKLLELFRIMYNEPNHENIYLEEIDTNITSIYDFINYAASYSKRFKLSKRMEEVVKLIKEIITDKNVDQTVIAFTLNKIGEQELTKEKISLVTLIMRSFEDSFIDSLKENNIFEVIFSIAEKMLQESLFDEIGSLNAYFLGEFGLMIKNNLSFVREYNYAEKHTIKPKISTFIIRAFSKKAKHTEESLLTEFFNIYTSFHNVLKLNECRMCIFDAIEDILKDAQSHKNLLSQTNIHYLFGLLNDTEHREFALKVYNRSKRFYDTLPLLISETKSFICFNSDLDKDFLTKLIKIFLNMINIAIDRNNEIKNTFDEENLLYFIANCITLVENKDRFEVLTYIIPIYHKIGYKYQDIHIMLHSQPFKIFTILYNGIKDLEIRKEYIFFIMPFFLIDQQNKLENCGFIYFLLRWLEGSELIQLFCDSLLKYLNSSYNIIQLYKVGITKSIINEISGIDVKDQEDIVLASVKHWLWQIGNFSFSKKDLKILLNNIVNCKTNNAIALIDSIKQIVALNVSEEENYGSDENIRRNPIYSIKALGGPNMFLTLFTKRKEINADFVNVLINLFSGLVQIERKSFNNQNFFILLNETFKNLNKECFDENTVNNLVSFYGELGKKNKKDMMYNFILDFKLVKNISNFVPKFFVENKECISNAKLIEFFFNIYLGYKEEKVENEKIENVVYNLIKLITQEKQHNIYECNLLYLSYYSIDSVMSKVCLRLLIDIKKKQALTELIKNLDFKPFIILLESENSEQLKLTIQLLSQAIDNLSNDDNKYNSLIYKITANANKLANVKDNKVSKFILQQMYSKPSQEISYQQYLPLICQLIKTIDEKDLEELRSKLSSKQSINKISSIYYLCIVYIMYVSKNYFKWCKVLYQSEFGDNDFLELIRSVCLFSSLPGVSTKEYIEIINYFVQFSLNNELISSENISILMFSIKHRIVFSNLETDSFENFGEFMRLIENAFIEGNRKFKVLETADFSSEYRQTIIDLIKLISSSNYSILNNDYSIYIFSDLLLTLIEMDNEFGATELEKFNEYLMKCINYYVELILNLQKINNLEEYEERMKQLEKRVESFEKMKILYINITAHLFNNVKDIKLKESVEKMALIVQDLESVSQNRKVNEVLILFGDEIRCISDSVRNSLAEIEISEYPIEMDLRNQIEAQEENLENNNGLAKLNMKELNKRIFNPVAGIWGIESNDKVQNKAIDVYGRHCLININYKEKDPILSNNEKYKLNNAIIFKLNKIQEVTLTISNNAIIFKSKTHENIKVIELKSIIKVIALGFCEIFTDDYKSTRVYIAEKEQFLKILRDKGIVVEDKEKLKEIAQRWTENKISNFEFIYLVNIFFGKSYNNPDDYPIFPFVISNLNGEKFDLSDESNYFDFNNNNITQEMKDFINNNENYKPNIVKTTLSFNSLIPEFYSNPFIYEGIKLPPWAKGNPYLFFMINRLALESSFVTKNLPSWIYKRFLVKVAGKNPIEECKVADIKKEEIKMSFKEKGQTMLNIPLIEKKELKLKERHNSVKVEEFPSLLNSLKENENIPVKFITFGDYLYIIKQGSNIIKIDLDKNKRTEKSILVKSTDLCLILRSPHRIVVGKKGQNYFQVYSKKQKYKDPITVKVDYPISFMSCNDFQSLIACCEDSSVFVWKDVYNSASTPINAHFETVVHAQVSKALNSVVTVDTENKLIVSSYNNGIPYSSVNLEKNPLQVLLTKMGLIVAIFEGKEKQELIVEVRDLLCNVIRTEKVNSGYVTACVAQMADSVEHLVICDKEKTKVIRLYDFNEKEINYKGEFKIAPSAVYNKKHRYLIIAEKSGYPHFFKI